MLRVTTTLARDVKSGKEVQTVAQATGSMRETMGFVLTSFEKQLEEYLMQEISESKELVVEFKLTIQKLGYVGGE